MVDVVRSLAEAERLRMIAEADAKHAGYSQFAGHWDSWAVGTVTRRVYRFGATLFDRGDRVLVDPDPPAELAAQAPPGAVRCYSWRFMVDVWLDPARVEIDNERTAR